MSYAVPAKSFVRHINIGHRMRISERLNGECERLGGFGGVLVLGTAHSMRLLVLGAWLLVQKPRTDNYLSSEL